MAPSISNDNNSMSSAEQWRASAVQAPATGAVPLKQASPPPRGFPRVPSLVFDIELEERGLEGQGLGCDHEHVGFKELKRWLLPSSTGEAQLRQDVELGLAQQQRQQQQHKLLLQQQQPQQQQEGGAPTASAVEANQRLAAFLTRLGYRVHIRTAIGGGDGYECLRNLRHVFLAVLPPGAHATTNRFVVDLSFKEQFRIAKPTARYEALLECLPHVYVAPEASVAPLVNFMCHEMAQAFSATGVVLPPWRQTMSMLSKWLPRKSLDEQVPRPGPGALQHAAPGGGGGPFGAAAASGSNNNNSMPRRSMDMTIAGQAQGQWHVPPPQQHQQPQQPQQLDAKRVAAQVARPDQQQQQQQQQVLPPAMAADMLHAMAAAGGLTRRQSSGPIVKPLSCEPQRVVVGGNFSAIGFAEDQ